MIDNRISWRLASFAFAALVVALWQLEASLGLISQIYLPSPERAVNSLVNGISNGTLVDRTLSTIQRMIYGWLLASLLGIVLGSLIGISKGARAYLEPML